jgi:AAA+ superfamily predicted ATPase
MSPDVGIYFCNLSKRFDILYLPPFNSAISLELPDQQQIQELIKLVLKEGKFDFDGKVPVKKLIEHAQGLSYYSIQKTLSNAVKRSLFAMKDPRALKPKINTQIWQDLLLQEKEALAIE